MKNAVVYRSTNKSLRDDASKLQQVVPIAAPAPQHVNQQQMAFMHLMQNFAAFMSGGAASSSSSAAGNLTNFQMCGRQQAPQHALPAVPGLPALPAPSPEETHQVKDTPTPPQAHGARVETTPPQAEVTPPCRRGQLSLFTPEEQAKRVQEAFEARESVKMISALLRVQHRHQSPKPPKRPRLRLLARNMLGWGTLRPSQTGCAQGFLAAQNAPVQRMVVPSVVSGSESTKLRVWVEWSAHEVKGERGITQHAGHKGARRAAVMRSVLTL